MSASDWPIAIDPVFGCHLWQGATTPNGYPSTNAGGWQTAHRIAYERDVGPIPEDHVLDHLCRRRSCVAAHHLEPVTKAANEKRKSYRYRARIQRCPRGHELALNAVLTPEGGRVCRACNRAAEGKP